MRYWLIMLILAYLLTLFHLPKLNKLWKCSCSPREFTSSPQKTEESLSFFIFCGGVSHFGRCHLVLRFLDHTQLNTHTHTHPAELLWTSDQPIAQAATYTKLKKTNIHALSGVWTPTSSNRSWQQQDPDINPFKRRVKSHLPTGGIIRSSPYFPR